MDRRSALALLAAAAVAAPQAAFGAKKVETQPLTVEPPKDPAPPATPTPDSDKTPPAASAPAALPKGVEVHGKGPDGLPPLVAKMRQRILDAAYAGDMDRLKIVIQSNETPPIFSVNEIGDPIEYLKKTSGDGEGLEILAIMTDVLESGWARAGIGTPQEMYVWPYFAATPIDHLEPSQLVEVYKILTSSDFEEMKNAGKYTFYAIGIGPDGTWHYFKLND